MMENTTTGSKRQAYAPNRSCERCRALKVKCIPHNSTKCQRCFRLTVDCIYALPAKRRPRKRTDVKVAELEKEVKALSAILRKQREIKSVEASSPSKVSVNHDPAQDPASISVASQSDTATHSIAGSTNSSGQESNQEFEPVDPAIVSHHLASEIFDLFRTGFLPRLPIISFPDEVTAEQVRTTRPLLFLAILGAASSRVQPSLGRILSKRIVSTIAEVGVAKGIKSLDLLQAILVATVWHYPENSFDHLKYFQYAHIAAGMIPYLGIEGRPTGFARKTSSGSTQFTEAEELSSSPASKRQKEQALLDGQRTLLACYIMVAGICRSLHRPTIIPYTSYMEKCVDNLLTSEYAASTDETLVYWFRTQRLMTESSTALGVDDADVEVDLSEQRVQRSLAFYDSRLKSLHPGLENPMFDCTLNYMFHVQRMSLHEVSLYIDHDPADFDPPFSIERLTKPFERKKEISPTCIESLSICWSSAVQALEIFLQSPIETLRCSPIVVFVRIVYCATIMLKMLQSAESSGSSASLFVDADREQFIQLIARLIPHLEEVGGDGVCPVAQRFALGLERIRAWCLHAEGINQPNSADDLLEPLRDINLRQETGEGDLSKDVVFDDWKSAHDTTETRTASIIPQEGASLESSEEYNSNGMEDVDFMAWDDFDWSVPIESSFDFVPDLLFQDRIDLTTESDWVQTRYN